MPLTHVCVAIILAAKTTVVVKPGQTLRDVAQQVFGDAELWPEVARQNHLDAASALPAQLTVDDTEVTRADAELARVHAKIEAAASAGAAVFASDMLDAATSAEAGALLARKQGHWDACRAHTAEALKAANEALSVANTMRDVAAVATLAATRGVVEARPEGSLTWREAKVKSILSEGDRVRTLSDAFAEVVFRDSTRLILSEHSQVQIHTMRVSQLNQNSDSSVSIVEGDASALLAPNASKHKLHVALAGMQTQLKVNSPRFWVGKEAGHARFANYDGKIELQNGGVSVQLLPNQGSSVSGNAPPSPPRDLLPAPALQTPADAAVNDSAPVFTWAAVPHAKHYWFELAHDRAFRQKVLSRKDAQAATLSAANIPEGIYYWRVASMDADGLPGPSSEARTLTFMHDAASPFVALRAPVDGASIDPQAHVTGEAEIGAKVTLNGAAVQTDARGQFDVPFAWQPGVNALTLTVQNVAGRSATLHAQAYLRAAEQIAITLDQNLPVDAQGALIATTAQLTLRGHGAPDADVSVSCAQACEARSRTDADGRFSMLVPATAQTLRVGASTLPLRVQRLSEEGPTLTLASEPQATVSNANMHLVGVAQHATRLTLNDTKVPVQDGHFDTTVTLVRGVNTLHLVATDAAGRSGERLLRVTFDDEPPSITRAQFSPKSVTGGEMVQLDVVATDAAGLRRAGSFAVRVGERVFQGILVLGADSVYRGAVRMPSNVRGAVALERLTLVDYLGNQHDTSAP